MTLNQTKLDFQHKLVNLHDGLVIANFHHIAGDLSNTLITEDLCIILPNTEQIFNVQPSNIRFEGRLLMIEPLSYHNRTRYLLERSISKTVDGKCACTILNPNREVLHIKKNTIIGTFEPIDDDDILTNHNDETLRKQVDDDEQTSNIITVTEQPKKTCEESGIKLDNDKLSTRQHNVFRTLIENDCDLL